MTSNLEPCADVILPGGGRSRSKKGGGGGGAVLAAKFVSKVPEKFRSILKVSMTFLVIDRKLLQKSTQQKWHRRRADQQKSSSAAGPTNCRRWRRGRRTALVQPSTPQCLRLS